MGVLATVLAATLAFAGGKMLSVQVKSSVLRANPSFLSPPRAKVAYGDRLGLLGERGPWALVEDSSRKGWIHQTAMTEKHVILNAGSAVAKRAASSGEVALAGKGFNDEVEGRYSELMELDFKLVDMVIASKVDEAKIASFVAEGKLNTPEVAQ
jgi:hypothetical protein